MEACTTTPAPQSMDRIVVIGTSCSGKTTFAAELARRLQLRHIELDQLHWLPDWQPIPLAEFRDRVSRSIAKERWVLDGNYSKVRDLVWPRATHLVWLDYSFPVIFDRALRRTFRRVFLRERLFADNRETLQQVLFDRESILWWVIRTYRRRRREYPQLLLEDRHVHLKVIVLNKLRDAQSFLVSLQGRS